MSHEKQDGLLRMDNDYDPILELRADIDLEDLGIQFTDDGKFTLDGKIEDHIAERVITNNLPKSLIWAFIVAYVHQVYQQHLKAGKEPWIELEKTLKRHLEVESTDDMTVLSFDDETLSTPLH